jgi:hypothetical protein
MTLALSETFYDGYLEYLRRQHQLRLISAGLPVLERHLETTPIVLTLPNYTLYQDGKNKYTLQSDVTLIEVCTREGVSEITIVSGDKDELEGVGECILSLTSTPPTLVKWMYKADGSSVRLPINTDTLPRAEFYPFLEPGTSLAQYYDNYLHSSSNILVLIGPPGTGKTSFIKGLIHHAKQGALVSYDNKILEDDQIFADFMSGRDRFMVLEDADTFLSSRNKSGNTIMHKFLNIGDGLISTGGKKIVFSTNLPSIRDIDSALIRPGRCFDVIHFDRLSKAQCEAVVPGYTGPGNITLAELLGGCNAPVQCGIGFDK